MLAHRRVHAASLSRYALLQPKPNAALRQAQRDMAVEAQVDEAAAELWGITDRELQEIQRSLEELG